MASALEHIQAHGMIHRDIACRNFVLSSGLDTVVLIDFGLSFILTDREYFVPRPAEQLPYQIHPPESLCSPNWFYKASDVWLLGIAFWETYHISEGTAFPPLSPSLHFNLLTDTMVKHMGPVPLTFDDYVPADVQKSY
eukprot:TRINITY_DN311_c0_g1_i4.p2 TRINITY_DN311_c0_g1~~TRINITY_DN311_c0_g1_i4.p2  ORF type:complete len:159 (-),score=47.35 TRINITY_DN311_c0_g1_i4:532-945(-)